MSSRRVAMFGQAVGVLLISTVSVALSLGGEPTRATTETKKTTAAAIKEPPSFSKGYQAYRAGNLDDALAAFGLAVKENPDHVPSVQYLARVNYEKKRYARAIELARRVAKMEPKNVRNWRTLGLAQMASGDLKGSVESFRKAAEAEPKDFWTQNNLGYALLQLDRNDEACKALEQAVKLDASKAMTWNTLGVARLRAGDRAGAIEAFKKALQIDPQHAMAKANLAAVEPPPKPKAP